MKKLIIFLSFSLAVIIISDSLFAMNWPSENPVLLRNFGANERGLPIMGMIFSAGGEVLAAESGEIIFSRKMNDSASRLPSPLGAWTAIDHEHSGLISIYSRYDDSSRTHITAANVVENLQPIANAGISGWSSREGFYFMLFDRRERHWINPAMIIKPAQEIRPPQIISVELRSAQGIQAQSRNLTQGRYTVIVNVAGGVPLNTQTNASFPFAPRRIECIVNGAEAGRLNFEAVSARDGVLMVSRNGLVSARQIYAHFPAFEAAEVFLTRGQASLEVIVEDISGIQRSFVTRLNVN